MFIASSWAAPPPGKAVFRAFLGGIRNEALLTEPDEALVAIVRRELSEILGEKTIGIHVEPEHHTGLALAPRHGPIRRRPPGAHAARITARVAALPGLRLAGNAYDGIGIPDCIRLGPPGRERTRGSSAATSASRSQLV